MKKIIKLFSSIALIFILVCIVTSCNGEKKPPITDEPPIDITPTPTPEETIKDIAELIAKYPNQLKSFLENEMIDDMVYVPTEKDYVDLDLVYASWYLGRITDSKLSYVSLAFTVKLDDTKRGYYVTDTKFENNPIDLNLIAKYDKTSSTNNFFPDSIWVGQVESLTVLYDAKEKQNDTKFLDDLYGSGALREDIVSIDYVNETFQVNDHTHSYTSTKFNETKHWKECSCGEKMDEETHTFGEWTTIKEASYTEEGQKKRECSKCDYEETETIPIEKNELSVEDIINLYGNKINENLRPLYLQALKNNYTKEDEVTSYRWDLGEISNDKISSLKLLLKYNISDTSAFIDVIDVKLKNELNINDLLDTSNITNISATYNNIYYYNYNPTEQYGREDLIKTILDVSVTDDFEYQMKDVIYKENSSSTDSDLGTIKRFSVVISNENGVREVSIAIKTASTDTTLITNINNGKYKALFIDMVSFTSNQLKEVDLTAPTDPNSIEYLIYYHNDKITANLETQYQSVLKKAFGRSYNTDRYDVLNYKWDLGEAVNEKVQNFKMTLTYFDNTFNATLLEVYDVKLNEAIEIKILLDDTAMASIKTTNTLAYTYTYDATKQNDMDEVWAKLAELELKGFEYKEVFYRWDSGSSEFGSSTLYTISYINNDKIEQVKLVIKDSPTNEGKISNLVNGYYRVPVNERVEIDFTLNQLKEVDLTAPTDPNSIEYLIYYHNDEITANLKTHYENAVKKAYGRYYDTDRFTMISYRWDLGEVVEGKIQNLKVILNYHNNVASVDILHVHNVILNEAIEMSSLLDATTMSNTKATYSSASSYTYDATKQHDMDEVWAKLAELELKGFEYEEALYTRTGGSVEFGGATGYTISYIDKRYIKEITVIIKATSTNFGWLKNLQNGNYKVLDTKEIDFTSNQLKEVDLTIE